MRWIQLGIVGKAHGLNGAFFISHRDEPIPTRLKELRIGPKPDLAPRFHLQMSRQQGERPLIACREITSREAAEALIMQEIWCERTDLELDEKVEYMWADLIGKDVVDAAGVVLGTIEKVGNFGASDIVRIVHPQRGVLEVPFVRFYFDMSFQSSDPSLKLLVTLDCFDDAWSKP